MLYPVYVRPLSWWWLSSCGTVLAWVRLTTVNACVSSSLGEAHTPEDEAQVGACQCGVSREGPHPPASPTFHCPSNRHLRTQVAVRSRARGKRQAQSGLPDGTGPEEESSMELSHVHGNSRANCILSGKKRREKKRHREGPWIKGLRKYSKN
ncbi:hypothetical protein QBC43DRAFT_81103 [Cladorrhinum sp. PSN259]|nr:hypothetical protein QBC43DRAFT_81103 [Cladorrhinum sp. PSN259]